MPRLSSLTRSHPVDVVFRAGDEVVSLTIDRNAFTPAWARRLEQGASTNDLSSVVEALAELIMAWDVVDDSGRPVKPSVGLAELPLPVLLELEQAIGNGVMPSSEEGNVSPEPSSSQLSGSEIPPIPATPLPNGQPHSPSPAPSASPSPT